MTEAADIRTVADIPRRHAEHRGDAVALVCGERSTTYGQLDVLSNRVANALAADGVAPQSRVAILDLDSDDAYVVLFGIAKARAVVMGINWRLAPREIAFILNDGGAEVLFVGPQLVDKLAQIEGELTSVRTIVTFTGERAGWQPYDVWLRAASEADPGLEANENDVVAQMYTSGTTGHPKGVMLANRSFFAIVRSMEEHGDPWIGWRADDVSLMCIPQFHIGGIWWAMTGMRAGARNVVLDAFIGWKALELLQRERVTKTCMVPAMMQVVMSEPGCSEADFSALEHIVYGGSSIPLPQLQQARETFGCEFAQIYGLTETGNTAVCLRPADHHDPSGRLLRAAGRPYPGVRAKVIDAQGNELGSNEVGEICLHSPANMVGYWNREEATAKTLIDGWIHTGDAGHIDEEGYIFVSDRIKDMIIYAGENIYPAEIESVLCGHPAVAEAAVIGVPDDRWGELVKAIVVLKLGAEAKQQEIIAHVRAAIADFKVPKSVDFVDALPRTPSGKIRKGPLREPYWKGRERSVN